jgi:hypothetical protein
LIAGGFRGINRDAIGEPRMTRTNKKQATTYNGFAIPLQPDTDLGLAMLIAEDEEGQYEPVAVVVSIAEGREIAANDLRRRMRMIERDEDAGLCPTRYKIWARGVEDAYLLASELVDVLK